MLIDWFTVGAQAANFLILVWLLKRLLYRPVLAAIDARQQKIAAQLQNAAQREAQALAQRDEFQRRSEALERDREGILRSASTEATAERQMLLEAARHDAQTLREKLTEVVGKEREELGRRLVTQTQAEVFALTRQTLADLAGISVEERMVEVFLQHLRRLPKEPPLLPDSPPRPTPDPTAPASVTPVRAAIVRTAFELSLPQRAAIKTAVTESLGPDITLRFESSPQLVCGIDLSVSGMKLAWSVADYLGSLSQDLLSLTEPAQASSNPPREASNG